MAKGTHEVRSAMTRLAAVLGALLILAGAAPSPTRAGDDPAADVQRCIVRADGSEVCVAADLPAAGTRTARRPTISELAALAPGETVTSDIAGGTPGIACDGNGVDGNRVQAVYVYRGTNDRYRKVAPLIRKWAAQVDTVFRASAARLGGYRRVRWVTSSTCVLSVLKVKVRTNPINNYWGWERELAGKGLSREDRHYLVWMDKRLEYGTCGEGDTPQAGTPGPDNRANLGPYYAYVVAPCWGQSARSGPSGHESSEAHELMHTLGAVQKGSPHSTGGHCWDEWDLMCYYDGGHRMVKRCGSTLKNRFDCGGNDYFNPRPAAGSWLATHWNTANSTFLAGVDKAGPTVSPPVLGDYLVTWQSHDDQLVLRATLQQALDGGPWTTVQNGGETGVWVPEQALARGHTYQFRVRVMDSSGRWSAWTAGDLVEIPLDAPPVVEMGTPRRTGYDADASAWTIDFPWSSTDDIGGVVAEEIQRSGDDGATWSGWDGGQIWDATPGHVYRLRVRAQDDTGQWGQWAVSAPVAVTADMDPVLEFAEVWQDEPGMAYVWAWAIDEGDTTLLVVVTDVTAGGGVAVADDLSFPVEEGHGYEVVIRARDAAAHLSEAVTVSHAGW